MLDVKGALDQPVFVGIRPEGFVPDENGPMTCALKSVEVMGRDVSVVSTHPAAQAPQIRSIINSDTKVDVSAQTIRFSLKPHKVFLFDAKDEKRIRFEVN